MKKSNNVNCESIERLLIYKDFDGLTEYENLLVEEHLKSCIHCQNFQDNLLNLQSRILISVDEKLIPDPTIRKKVIQRMQALKPEEKRIFRSSWQYIRSILEYRIPVYQALLGIACILLIFITINQLSFNIDRKSTKKNNFAPTETLISDHLNVIENLEIIERQKIGRNVKEDSVLTRYIVPAM